jgi:hypothetical protein
MRSGACLPRCAITARLNLRAKRQSKQNDCRFARRNFSSREIRFDGFVKSGELCKIATERERSNFATHQQCDVTLAISREVLAC